MSEGSGLKREEIVKFADLLGFGLYRVNHNGQFVECDARAREIFGLPQDETDLSKYSIKDLYVVPAERELRIKKLMEDKGKPLSGSLVMRINGEHKLLFDICRYDESYQDQGNFVGMISENENSTIFPKMFDTFPMGLYELDNEGNVARVNKKLVEILKYNILGRPIKEICEDKKELDEFNQEVIEKGIANRRLSLKDAKNKIIEVECFSQNINNYELARWGMVTDVTTRERYYRALDSMPTGYFHIENERIKDCNERFVRIQGFENKKAAIGVHTRELFADEAEREKYLRDLKIADKEGKALQDYPLLVKRIDDGKIITVSVDSHLVKDSKGKVIGREGTVRDITEKVELEKRVKENQERLKKTTADLNQLIHTFLHPVLKYSGHSELFHKLGKILFKSIRLKAPVKTNIRRLGKELEDRLTKTRERLESISEMSDSATVLEPKFEKIINILDYNLDKASGSKILMDKAIRDACLWVLEELESVGFFNENFKRGKLEEAITSEFIKYLQDILFDYLIRTALILQNETQLMIHEVEALVRYIEVGEKRIYNFRKYNLAKILDENVEVFKPILAQRDIGIEYTPPGHLNAWISRTDIDRVICNLLHNAVKYSHAGPGRVVRIKTRNLYRENAVEFSISSYGTPIKQEEIDSGAIFKFGYRGILAYKTDRDGTGLGLADAKDVIKGHNGNITITSEPARDDEVDPPQYKVPYITTVNVRLPKTMEKRRLIKWKRRIWE